MATGKFMERNIYKFPSLPCFYDFEKFGVPYWSLSLEWPLKSYDANYQTLFYQYA